MSSEINSEINKMRARNLWQNYGLENHETKMEFVSYLINELSKGDVQEAKTIGEQRKQKEQQETEIKSKEEEKRRKIMNMFDSKAPPLFRNRGRDSEAWIICLTSEPTPNLEEHVSKVKKNPRNFGSIYNHQVPEFIQAIEAELMRRQQAEQPNKEKSILSRVKEKLYST